MDRRLKKQRQLFRVRFYVNPRDPRPVKWPPPGPFWVSGFSVGGRMPEQVVVIAYVERLEQVREYWPEARIDSFQVVDEVRFSSRFPKPDWWEDDGA